MCNLLEVYYQQHPHHCYRSALNLKMREKIAPASVQTKPVFRTRTLTRKEDHKKMPNIALYNLEQ